MYCCAKADGHPLDKMFAKSFVASNEWPQWLSRWPPL
jgi:hypothetical protein